MQDQGCIYQKDDYKEMSLLDNQVFKRIRNGEKQLSKYQLLVIIDLFIEMIKAIEKIHEKLRMNTSINPGIFMIKPDLNHTGRIKIQVASEIIGSQKDILNINRLPYLSPEQTGRTGRSIDHRTDFYSLGITMYELLVGQKPFAAENMVEMIYCHIAKKPVAPDMINPEIPKTISKIIMKLVEKEPEQRYQSAAGICYDLEQCRKSLTLSGVVEDFEIGMNDHSSIFKIPQKLYGRDKESKTISQIYRKAAKGGTQILLVSGYPGVGKTTIIQESFRPVLKPGVFFASGKAEPLQSNTPYFVFSQIAKELIRMLLQEPDVILNQWKNRLLKALDHNGQLIIDLVPELQLIIGTQTGVKELEPTENKNRFLNTFGNLFKIFASKKHPLTIFFDDFQWCDLSSLELIRYLIDLTDIESLIVIIGYRDNEIQENHPLNHSLNELRKADKTTELVVKSLDEENVACIIIDAVHCDNERADSLAKIIYKKTMGNPFFVRNLLLHLHTSQYIRYNEAIHLWEWDVAEIQKIEISKNIVDFMINQILELPIMTQDLLKVAALIGTTFNLKILADVQRINVDKVVDNLKQAVEREIIIPEHHYYDVRHEGDDRAFKFAHDRVQQACAVLIEQEGQKQLHLKIGYSIKQRLPADVVRDQAMGIVCHLNEGLDQIECREERFEAARLNLWACQKAKAASSFQLSLQYISKAISLLTDHAWKQDYELTFEMIKVYAECAYLNKEYALAEQQIEILMRHARNSIDQAEIRLMQSILYRFLGQFENVIKYGIQGLSVLGIRMPSEPGLHAVIKELIIVKSRLWGKSTETLLKAPPLQSDKVKLIIRIMSELNSVTYNGGNVNLFLLSTLKSLNLTIRYGNSREAASIYSAYAILLAVLGDLKNSYQFNKLALTLVESEERAQYRASIYFAYGFLGYSWSESFHDVDQWFKKTMEEAIRYGDHYQIALAGTFMYVFKGDTNLEVLIAKAMEHVPLIRQTSNKFGYYSSFLFLHRWLNYAGLTDDLFSLNVSQETFDRNGTVGIVASEEECLENLRQINALSVIGVYYKEKMYIHYLYDDYAGALNYLKESDKYLKNHSGTPYIVECRICSFLVIAANLSEMEPAVASKSIRRLKREYKYVNAWATYNPENFLHLQYLLDAELARIEGKNDRAIEWYELAAKTAQRNGFIRDEALANELAAKLFLARGMNKQAAFFMTEALNGYRLWGATAKTRQITEKYDDLLNLIQSRKSGLAKDEPAMIKDIDLVSIISAYQTITKEVQLSDLLRQIVKIVVENSGAQKAYILLKDEQVWQIEAEYLEGKDEIKVLQALKLSGTVGLLPESVINFCIHTGENLVLNDAAAGPGDFETDDYIQKNQTRSLLCMPIKNQGETTGLLYLENNLSANVFTNDRLQVLELLTAQFSISIKNVQLFSNLIETKEELHRSMEELLRSEIAFLQAQIKPHFLFNALNTIAAFSLDEPQMTRELLVNLSQFLRGSFDFKNRDKLIPLQKELELVDAYLFIEKARFGERLQVVYDIDKYLDCLLPPLVIQPLVENAVQHGLVERKKGGTVTISAHRKEDGIIISVADDGVGMPEDPFKKPPSGKEGAGVALKNINMRLLKFYDRGLEIGARTNGGTRATIFIPMENKSTAAFKDDSQKINS